MLKIDVKASTDYSVLVGENILPTIGQKLWDIKRPGTKVAVISDDNVFPLYGQTVIDSLKIAGFIPVSYTFAHGEASKNLQTYQEVLSFLAKERITRSDILIALGGGVVGDLTGFCAASFLRGIPFVQIPTTILAAVDSSVGGKTAVDLPEGKNLVGAFHQPSLVLCDTNTFSTLDARQVACGYAEIIKYGVMCDEELFEALENRSMSIEEIITRCVEIKRDVVEMDEFDNGERKKLNLGHTIGHAVEILNGFSLNHGEAVACGMVAISRIAENSGFVMERITDRLIPLLKAYGLPFCCPNHAMEIFSVAASDKKTEGSHITLVIPTKIGDCMLRTVSLQEFSEMLSLI